MQKAFPVKETPLILLIRLFLVSGCTLFSAATSFLGAITPLSASRTKYSLAFSLPFFYSCRLIIDLSFLFQLNFLSVCNFLKFLISCISNISIDLLFRTLLNLNNLASYVPCEATGPITSLQYMFSTAVI